MYVGASTCGNEGGHSIVSAEAGTAGRQGDRGRGRHRGYRREGTKKKGCPGGGTDLRKKLKTVTGGPGAGTRRKNG